MTLESCEHFVEAHWTTPEQWGLEPLQSVPEMMILECTKDLLFLQKLANPPQAESPKGVPSLSDTVKSLILTQIDAQYLQRYEPMPPQKWAAHFGIRTDSMDDVSLRQRLTATTDSREPRSRASAISQERIQSCDQLAQALGLPERLMGDLLSAVSCQMCYQLSNQQDGTLVEYEYRVPQTRRPHNNVSLFCSGYVCRTCRAGFKLPA
jgi:hypothetical protein